MESESKIQILLFDWMAWFSLLQLDVILSVSLGTNFNLEMKESNLSSPYIWIGEFRLVSLNTEPFPFIFAS